MEIYPLRLALLLICSAAFGAAVGMFNDVNRIVRVFCGVRYTGRSFDRLYELKMPFTGRVLGAPVKGKTGKALLGILIFFQDLLMLVYAAVGCVVMNYYLNNGQFRLYTPVAMVFGFAVYYFTVGKLVMIISEPITFFIRAAALTVAFVVSYPVRLLFSGIKKLSSSIIKKVRKSLAKKENMRYNKRKRRELEELSRRGFIGVNNAEN